MSEFADFMTMKIIEIRRSMNRGVSNKEFEVQLLEKINAVKNLNVRVPIHTIAQIETLASWAGVSKAELVLEMLSSSIEDALEMLEKAGSLDSFNNLLFNRLQTDYGVTLKRDEDGNVRSFEYPKQESAKASED